MLIFFCWIIWFWLLITIFADIFRRKDTSGFSKVLWIIFVIILPFLGVFIYLIVNHDGMADRSIKQAQSQQAQMDDYIRSTAGWRRRSGDREGQGPARLGRDHAGRVRRDQGEGARRVTSARAGLLVREPPPRGGSRVFGVGAGENLDDV